MPAHAYIWYYSANNVLDSDTQHEKVLSLMCPPDVSIEQSRDSCDYRPGVFTVSCLSLPMFPLSVFVLCIIVISDGISMNKSVWVWIRRSDITPSISHFTERHRYGRASDVTCFSFQHWRDFLKHDELAFHAIPWTRRQVPVAVFVRLWWSDYGIQYTEIPSILITREELNFIPLLCYHLSVAHESLEKDLLRSFVPPR